MIKWVTNIDLLKEESQDYYHFYDNKVLPSHVDAEKAKVRLNKIVNHTSSQSQYLIHII